MSVQAAKAAAVHSRLNLGDMAPALTCCKAEREASNITSQYASLRQSRMSLHASKACIIQRASSNPSCLQGMLSEVVEPQWSLAGYSVGYAAVLQLVSKCTRSESHPVQSRKKEAYTGRVSQKCGTMIEW